MRLPIYPFAAFTDEQGERLRSTPADDPFPFPHTKLWGPRAKWLLQHLLAHIGIKRTDEIAILTTSDWTYVSTCLSVTAFNFARVSRVVSDATKVVIVVHEFGYAFPNLAEKSAEWKSKGILVVEDCAHLVGLSLTGGYVGSFGDFTLISLPKILPTPVGGLMLARKPFYLPAPTGNDEQNTVVGQRAAALFLNHHRYLSSERLVRHRVLKQALGDRIWEPVVQAIPFASYVRITEPRRDIADVEFLSSLAEDFRIVPTNPFVDIQVFSEIAELL